MSSKLNIFFCGYPGAGKTFCSEYLEKRYGYTQTKFARPVYSIATELCGMTKKDRSLLQLIGTDIGRSSDPNIWIDRFKQDITIAQEVNKRLGNNNGFVSDDTRFFNEFLVLIELGWVGIYLDVHPEVRKQRLIGRDGTAQEETLNHIAETSLDEFKDLLVKVDASGTPEQMYENLEQTLDHIRKEQNEVR
jgi:dephospho-CoA kinase